MKKALKITGKILLWLLILIVVFLIIMTIINQMLLKKDRKDLKDHIGQMVEIDGSEMCVYTEGEGDHTLVFMSGSGTASPIYDFKTICSRLSDDNRVVVIEKFGYGFSDIVDGERDFDTILRQDREALEKLGIEGPFILCPHSMSGLEALMWAQEYPDEVEAIVGLDMAVPEAYDVINDASPNSDKLASVIMQAVRECGIFRLMGDDFLINRGELTDDEIAVYRKIIYTKAANDNMLSEGLYTAKACEEIRSKDMPETPMLLFVSDGSGGTGMDTETWRGFTEKFAESIANERIVELDCGHYVHDFEYERISKDIKEFIKRPDSSAE